MSNSLPIDPADNEDDPRHRFIARVTRNRSFIDIGGLYHGIFEPASVAYAAGARSVALMDVEGPECPWWPALKERLVRRGVRGAVPPALPTILSIQAAGNNKRILHSNLINAPTSMVIDRDDLRMPAGSYH